MPAPGLAVPLHTSISSADAPPMARSVSYQNQVIPGTQTWDPAQSGFGYDSGSSMRGFGYASGTGTARPTPPENPLGQSRGRATSVLGASIGYSGALPQQAQQAQYAPVLTRAPSLQPSAQGYNANTMQPAINRSKSVQPLSQKPQQAHSIPAAALPVNPTYSNPGTVPGAYSGYQQNHKIGATPLHNAQGPLNSVSTLTSAPINAPGSVPLPHKPLNSSTATATSSYQHQLQNQQQQQLTYNKAVSSSHDNATYDNINTSVGYGQTHTTTTKSIPPPALPLSQPTHPEIVLSEEALAQLFALEQSLIESTTVPVTSSIVAPAATSGYRTGPALLPTAAAPVLVKTVTNTEQPLTLSEADLAHLLELEQAFELSQSQPNPPAIHVSAPVVPLQATAGSSHRHVASSGIRAVVSNVVVNNAAEVEMTMTHLSEDVMAQLLALEESAYAEMSIPVATHTSVLSAASPAAPAVQTHTAQALRGSSAASYPAYPALNQATNIPTDPSKTMSTPLVPVQQLTPLPVAAPLLCMRLVALDVVDDPTRRLREVRAFQPGTSEDSSNHTQSAGQTKQQQHQPQQSEIGGTLLTVELTGEW